MTQEELEASIQKIQAGNEAERERLIQFYKPYILQIVGKICKQYKTWNDDEASIGLIAFNQAINTFDSGKGRTFFNYVYLLISQDLIDFFRKENRNSKVQLSSDLIEENDSREASMQMNMDNEHQAIVDEILLLKEELAPFYIRFEELEAYTPKHKRTRRKILQMAVDFIKDETLVKQLYARRRFPMNQFVASTVHKEKTIEKYRKYLITIIIILLHPEWRYLRDYIPLNKEVSLIEK